MGCLIGAVVDLLREGVAWLHVFDFGIPADHYLSEGVGRVAGAASDRAASGRAAARSSWRARCAPGGSNEIVDPIEANALHGGRMSLRDSLWLTVATVMSNGAGASLGMEAGYSQLGAGLYSWVGRWFRLRRADLRVFVTAGAAAAIAAAFNAPLAGAFYGYELILGSYTTKALAPVIVATVSAALTQRAMSHMKALFDVTRQLHRHHRKLFPVRAAGRWARRAIAVAGDAGGDLDRARACAPPACPNGCGRPSAACCCRRWRFIAPQVLGSGHGAVQFHFDVTLDACRALAALLVAKLLASAISVGSGFRGGLFSSALFHRHACSARCSPRRRPISRQRSRREHNRLHAGRDGRRRGRHHRRAAHHGVPGAGSHRRFPGHGRRW